MNTRRAPLAIALLAIVGVVAWLPACTTRSLDITDVTVEATVQPDGTMVVVEHLTYEFHGDYNGGTRSIPPSSRYQVVDVTVVEDGRSLELVDANPASLRWRGLGPPGKVTGRHTYDLSYRVIGAVTVAPDVGELYWQFVGADFPFVAHVGVTITMPGPSEGIEAFAHGALNGVVAIDGNQVTLSVDDNPAGTFVEARVLASAAGFTVPPSGEPKRDRILAEELRAARDADARKVELREEIDRRDDQKRLGTLLTPVVAVAALVAFAAIFRRWGKEPRQPDDIGDYWREVPAEPPAICKAVLDFGQVGQDSLSFTLLDLAQRGFLSITETHDGYEFTRRSPSANGRLTKTSGYEEQALDWMFAEGSTTTQDELTERAKADRTASVTWINEFKAAVRAAAESHNYVDRRFPAKWAVHGLLIVLVALAGFGIAIGLQAPVAWALLGVAALLIALSPVLRKRTAAGARKAAELAGLRRFLRDFSRLNEEAYVGDLVLYERYLVYAVMLGVAKELLDGLQLRLPEVVAAGSGFAPWFIGSSLTDHGDSRLGGLGSVGSFAAEFTSATAAAMAPPSSTGGGGGFSGGGGGGGGGGGAGGW